MKEFVSGGTVLAALFAANVAVAQPAPTTSLPTTSHARRSFFNSDQPRSDVAAHTAKMFAQLDLNHDGFITAEELAASKAKFDDRMSKSAPKRAEKAFARLDVNHDGQVTQAEVEAARPARSKRASATRRTAPSRLFAEADANKDGIVTRAEYSAAVESGRIKTRHANMRGNAIARLFAVADVNKDGRVSLEEAQKAALEHFDSTDLNHDGMLTPDERRQASRNERGKRRASATRAAQN